MEINLIKITCADCKVLFWIDRGHYNRLERSKDSFFCPSGHAQSYSGKSDKTLLHEEKVNSNRYKNYYEDELKENSHLKKSISTYKGHLARKK